MVTINSSNGGAASNSSSAQLVETVSIDYDDFNDTFLTCATCLCVYDGGERAPKLLPCSHTVCVHCLTRIAAAASNRRTLNLDGSSNAGRSGGGGQAQSQDAPPQQTVPQRQTFRCPICRELIVVPPNGGVAVLPPSFLVNQLLDLISTHRRRTLIPTCCGGGGLLSSHLNQELLYCETCDQVFCPTCTKHETTASNGNNLVSSKSIAHTVIPVSVAMKRTSEIMLYKANECVTKLNSSRDEVCSELDRLDTARSECLTTLDETFNDLLNILENRKKQLQLEVNSAYEVKHKILTQQLSSIEIEKTKVMDNCSNVQMLDIQAINQQIQVLNDCLQKPAAGIYEPRENAFIALELNLTEIKTVVNNAIGKMGRIRTTTTCPGRCLLDVPDTNEECLTVPHMVGTVVATLTAVDFDGKQRTLGGDPVIVTLTGPLGETQQKITASSSNCQQVNEFSDCLCVVDHKNGQYSIRLRLSKCERYQLCVHMLGRLITFNNSLEHVEISVSKNINPVCQYNREPPILQPASITMDSDNSRVYVLDTGNCRIRILDTNLNYICDIQNDSMRGRSSTGIGLLNDKTLVTVDWRTNNITQMTINGETIKSWSHSSMVEPMCVVVDRSYDHVLIGDSSCNIHAFKGASGQHLFTINNKHSAKSSECIGSFMALGKNSQIVVISHKTKTECRSFDIYSCKGVFDRSITVCSTADKLSIQSYSSLTTCDNLILATRRHFNSYVIDIINMDTDQLVNTVNSNLSKLRRPAGMVTFAEPQNSAANDDGKTTTYLSYYLLVTDIAADVVFKYQFF